ncbi:MAG: class I SAM-dependent methyltransferase [Pseudomonadota bacterium]
MAHPAWLEEVLGTELPHEGVPVSLAGQDFVVRDGILRGSRLLSRAQAQTGETFGFKWHQRETFERPGWLAAVREWLINRYGDITAAPWFFEHGDSPLVLDAGCGAAMSAMELFAPVLGRIRSLGVDVSPAVDVAAARFAERGLSGGFMQADLMNLPLAPGRFDLIFSEGVLHHTDSTEAGLKALVPLLRPGGRILFYVYRRKGPLREFTDDYIREKLQPMQPQDAWEALKPLTRLGIVLGDLNLKIDVPEAVDLLGIPAGAIDIQRLFYWHIFKAFYRPDCTFDEMHHINFDWYTPKNAHRQTVEEVRVWCAEAGLDIERESVEEAGIAMICRRPA